MRSWRRLISHPKSSLSEREKSKRTALLDILGFVSVSGVSKTLQVLEESGYTPTTAAGKVESVLGVPPSQQPKSTGPGVLIIAPPSALVPPFSLPPVASWGRATARPPHLAHTLPTPDGQYELSSVASTNPPPPIDLTTAPDKTDISGNVAKAWRCRQRPLSDSLSPVFFQPLVAAVYLLDMCLVKGRQCQTVYLDGYGTSDLLTHASRILKYFYKRYCRACNFLSSHEKEWDRLVKNAKGAQRELSPSRVAEADSLACADPSPLQVSSIFLACLLREYRMQNPDLLDDQLATDFVANPSAELVVKMRASLKVFAEALGCPLLLPSLPTMSHVDLLFYTVYFCAASSSLKISYLSRHSVFPAVSGDSYIDEHGRNYSTVYVKVLLHMACVLRKPPVPLDVNLWLSSMSEHLSLSAGSISQAQATLHASPPVASIEPLLPSVSSMASNMNDVSATAPQLWNRYLAVTGKLSSFFFQPLVAAIYLLDMCLTRASRADSIYMGGYDASLLLTHAARRLRYFCKKSSGGYFPLSSHIAEWSRLVKNAKDALKELHSAHAAEADGFICDDPSPLQVSSVVLACLLEEYRTMNKYLSDDLLAADFVANPSAELVIKMRASLKVFAEAFCSRLLPSLPTMSHVDLLFYTVYFYTASNSGKLDTMSQHTVLPAISGDSYNDGSKRDYSRTYVKVLIHMAGFSSMEFSPPTLRDRLATMSDLLVYLGSRIHKT